MSETLSYIQNDELFRQFYSRQSQVTADLARHPLLIRAWLQHQPRRSSDGAASVGASKAWRTARLSMARRRELAGFIAAAAGSEPGGVAALARWLLAAVPARIYLEIAAEAQPSLRAIDPPADDSSRDLARRRESLFLINYGLVKSAAYYGPPQEYGDRLSAASCGLLDAIDRYVPGAEAARFSYFASYWIRYHLARHAQKTCSVVAFPVHQHRLGRRIERCLAASAAGGGPPPSEASLCAQLNLRADALYWQRRRPKVVSLDAPADWESESEPAEPMVGESEPAPGSALDGRETEERLRRLLRRKIDPATRIMLAYTRGIGPLAEAAQDYLASLQALALAQLNGAVRDLHRSASR